MRTWCLVILSFLLLPSHARAAEPLARYFGNSLLCKAQSTGAVCDLWLDPTGRYAVFYDSGQKAYVKGVAGDFENEGRTGQYSVTGNRAGLKICLTPDVDDPPRPPTHSPALFRDAGCVTLPSHPFGQIWTLTFRGERYRVGLIKGR